MSPKELILNAEVFDWTMSICFYTGLLMFSVGLGHIRGCVGTKWRGDLNPLLLGILLMLLAIGARYIDGG